MYHLKLLEIARLVGLTQADIARHLDISSVQVTRWAKGTRPLPPKHLDALWALVYMALEKFVESGKADVWPEGISTLATLGRPSFRQQLEELLDELAVASLERRDEGPSTWIASTLVALAALPQDPKALRKPGYAEKMIELGRDLAFYGTLLKQIGPIQDLLEETDHATDTDAHEFHESGSDGGANALHQ